MTCSSLVDAWGLNGEMQYPCLFMFVITLYPANLIVSHCDVGDFSAPRGRSVHGRYFYLGEEILAALPMAAIKLVSGAWCSDELGNWVCLEMMKHGESRVYQNYI